MGFVSFQKITPDKSSTHFLPGQGHPTLPQRMESVVTIKTSAEPAQTGVTLTSSLHLRPNTPHSHQPDLVSITLQMKLYDAAIPDEKPKVTASKESSPAVKELASSQPGLVQFETSICSHGKG